MVYFNGTQLLSTVNIEGSPFVDYADKVLFVGHLNIYIASIMQRLFGEVSDRKIYFKNLDDGYIYHFSANELIEATAKVDPLEPNYAKFLETITDPAIVEAIELAKEAKELAEKADVEINSWDVVQQIVRLGLGSKLFSIGDQLVCNHETYGTLVWDIIGIDHDTPADSEYQHSLTLQLHECLSSHHFQFDAAEPTNLDALSRDFGSHTWKESGLRQWLNSDGDAGTWWTAKTEYDVEPDYASSRAGFLKGLDAEFLSVVGSVIKETVVKEEGWDELVRETEKFFLPSITEVYGGEQSGGLAEGVAYPYYADHSDLSAAGTGEDSNRIKYKDGSHKQFYFLRSANLMYPHSVWGVNNKGQIQASPASYEHGVAPVCCIV